MEALADTKGFGADGGGENGSPERFAYSKLANYRTDIPTFDENLPQYRAHWQVFFPPLVLALGYLVVWLYLVLLGMNESKLAKLAIVALAVFVPILAVQALLRYQTICLQVLPGDIRYHPGWPRRIAADIPAELVRKVVVKRGLAGHLFGGGTLRINLVTGQHVSISDLKNPKEAKAEILAMVKNARQIKS